MSIEETWRKVKTAWNEYDQHILDILGKTSPDDTVKHPQHIKLTEEDRKLKVRYADGEHWIVWASPYRRAWERYKWEIDRICGAGAALALTSCCLVLLILLVTGGSQILAAFGIAMATCFGGFLVLNRFNGVRRFVLRYYHMVDLAMFIIAFAIANTVFGFQVAAITGILISICLIVWKWWTERGMTDKELKEHRKKSAVNKFINIFIKEKSNESKNQPGMAKDPDPNPVFEGSGEEDLAVLPYNG